MGSNPHNAAATGVDDLIRIASMEQNGAAMNAITLDQDSNPEPADSKDSLFKGFVRDAMFALVNGGSGLMNVGPAFAVTPTGQRFGQDLKPAKDFLHDVGFAVGSSEGNLMGFLPTLSVTPTGQSLGRQFDRATDLAKDIGFALGNSGANLTGFLPAFALTRTGQDIGDSYDQGHAQYELGMLGMKVVRDEDTEDDDLRINELQQQRDAYQGPRTLGGDLLGGPANMAGSMLPMFPHSAAVGGVFGAVSMGAGAETGPGALLTGLGGFSLDSNLSSPQRTTR